MLRYLHSNSTYRCDINMRSIKFLVALIFISVCAVRFNLINSIHNFVILESQNQYYYYICSFLLYSYICCANMYYITKYKIYIYKNIFLLLCLISVFSEFFKIIFITFSIKYIYTYIIVITYIMYTYLIKYNYISLLLLLL